MTQAVVENSAAKKWEQPWLSSPRWDAILIIAPAFITSVVAIAFREQLDNSQYMPLWAWVSLVLVVDVAHVYATLFRTYFDKRSFSEHQSLLVLIPLGCWIVGWLLYRTDDLLFWRTLAYLAVFHFIRQQYGFVALYSRKDPSAFKPHRWLDQLCIYTVTLYPLLYWHTHLPRNFNWFVSGDFVEAVPPAVNEIALAFYFLVAVSYLVKELVLLKRTGFLNAPKNLIVFGTAMSWWVGIVALNSDLAFTMTNVITHGVPYMALIWLYHSKNADSKKEHSRDNDSRNDYSRNDDSKNDDSKNNDSRNDHSRNDESMSGDVAGEPARRANWKFSRDILLTFAPAFLVFLIALAYLEEGLWDGFVWREHLSFFAPFANLPAITEPAILAVLVPLLSLPQSTHYVLDGFIWRVKDKASSWSA